MRKLSALTGLARARVASGGVGFLLPVIFAAVLLAGCSTVASRAGSALANSLSTAIMEQDDPELVREAMPSYLLMIDSFIISNPDSVAVLNAGGRLYAGYGAVFVSNPTRAKVLTARARNYGSRALCAADKNGCDLNVLPYDQFVAMIGKIGPKSAEELYTYCLTNLAYIRSNSDDYIALANLPKIEYAMKYLLEIGGGSNEVDTYIYLGVLSTLRPAALGGHPEEGKEYFETAIALSDGENLPAKVEYARSYARLVYDRELHDQLLSEVLAAPATQPGQTLFNVMAQQQATELLATADDYF